MNFLIPCLYRASVFQEEKVICGLLNICVTWWLWYIASCLEISWIALIYIRGSRLASLIKHVYHATLHYSTTPMDGRRLSANGCATLRSPPGKFKMFGALVIGK